MSKTEELAFEEAMERLEQIVTQLERGDLPLDKSLESFEKGAAYVKQCQDKLATAEMRIEKIMKTKEEK
ncbi:MAG: exodeoxyribonuclease VII small subunit [Alphaproteobacteria bacterium]|jgi:exodeoxyribonuclease VII small subunit